MSAIFIATYAGQPLHFHPHGKVTCETTTRERATQFPDEAAAWHRVHQAQLPPAHVNVQNLNAEPLANLS